MAGYFLAAPYFAISPQIWEMGEGLEILFLEAISLFLVVLFGISLGGNKNLVRGAIIFLITMAILVLPIINSDPQVIGPFFSAFKPTVWSLLYLVSSTTLKILAFLNDRSLHTEVFHITSIALAFLFSIFLIIISGLFLPDSKNGFFSFFGFLYYFILADRKFRPDFSKKIDAGFEYLFKTLSKKV